MLRTFAAALVASTLVAGTAFAADPGAAASTPATSAAPAAAATTNMKADQTAKPVKHTHKGTRKHLSRGKSGKIHQARHLKGSKTHQANGTGSAKHS
jgi:hypothetical protein